MYADRILKLADYMESIRPESYNQDAWFGKDGDWHNLSKDLFNIGEAVDDIRRQVTIAENACGTTMCVLGHAVAAIPEAGLIFVFEDRYQNQDTVFRVDVVGPDTKDGGYTFGPSAGAFALDIPYSHAEVLFGSSQEDDTIEFYGKFDNQVVAAKLREYVETAGANVQAVIDR